MKYIFGPVYSRRFGISLGIDLSPDKKRCNFDCLYCELDRGKSTEIYTEYPEPEDIISELKEFLKKNPYPDVITITANGEPTLYPPLKELIQEINRIKKTSKTLILSNASTIYRKEIQETLKLLDIVKLSLDAVDPDLFKKVDRPINIDIKQIINGIKDFRKIFKGELIIEILIVKYVNDTEENILKIRDILSEIKPDRVDIGTIDRPPAYRVFPVSNQRLYQLATLLKGLPVNVVARKYEKSFEFDLTEEEILNTLSKRPLTEEDIENTFSPESKKVLHTLLKEGKIKTKDINGTTFYLKI